MSPAHDRRSTDDFEALLARAETEPAASRELDFLADLVGAAERRAARAEVVVARRSALLERAWLLPAAATLLFALALALWLADRDGARPVRLALGAPPVFVVSELRGEATLAAEFQQAMEPYARSDWPAARAALAGFLAQQAEHAPAHFYLAVVLGELGERDAARAHYSTAARSLEPLLAAHARYRRALLDLAEGRFAEGRAELEGLAAEGGPLAELAREALAEAAR